MRTLKSLLFFLCGFGFMTLLVAVSYVAVCFWVRLLRALWVY